MGALGRWGWRGWGLLWGLCSRCEVRACGGSLEGRWEEEEREKGERETGGLVTRLGEVGTLLGLLVFSSFLPSFPSSFLSSFVSCCVCGWTFNFSRMVSGIRIRCTCVFDEAEGEREGEWTMIGKSFT